MSNVLVLLYVQFDSVVPSLIQAPPPMLSVLLSSPKGLFLPFRRVQTRKCGRAQ